MNIKIKVIKNEEDYKNSLKLIEHLMSGEHDPESEEGEKLSILAKLVEDYELKIFPESLPDPIDAIRFRMEQQDLKPSDLVPYIGSSSRVSEILSRKRSLTLPMIRALESGLGIPAKVLLKESDDFRDAEDIAWSRFPLNEMKRRGYIDEVSIGEDNIKNIMEKFFRPVGALQSVFGMLRKTNYRSLRQMDKHALVVWSAFVVKKAKKVRNVKSFEPGIVDLAFMQKLTKLSSKDNGPVLIQKFLKTVGIILIIEPAFPQTYLDGATLIIDKQNPIIGLTLRHDRLDNFWFTLMHELAHISLHYEKKCNFFYDDLDNKDINNKEEVEADSLARESLVPESKWEVSPAKLIPSPLAAKSLARELGVHTSIVAGKIRYEGGKYIYLNQIINQAKVRKYFPNEKWNK